MKFCANISFMFGEASSIIERYALAKTAGFKAVESAFPAGFTVEQVKQAKESAGVEQILINLKTDQATPVLTAIPGKENEFKAAFATTVEYAKALKARKVHIMAGVVDNPAQNNWVTYENNLKYAADVLKTENLMGLIEPINHYSVPGYFLSDFGKASPRYRIMKEKSNKSPKVVDTQAVEIIKRIDSPHLRLMLDVFHLQQIHGDIAHNITKLMPYVGHVQIAQVPDRNEPDTAGELNYKFVLQYLAQAGYNDWVGLEYKPLTTSQGGLEWVNKFGYNL